MRLILLLIFSLLISCSVRVAGGPGGQTTNGIIGVVSYSGGVPIKDSKVSLRRKGFSPRDSILVDSLSRVDGAELLSTVNGVFEFEGIIPGTYVLECLLDDSLGLIDTFTVSEDSDTLDRGTLSLVTTGSISGSVDTEFISLYDSVSVHISGLNRSVLVEDNGAFTITGLAPWDYSLIITGYSGETVIETEESVAVTSGNVVSIGEVGEGINPVQYKYVRDFMDKSGLEDIPVREVVSLSFENISDLNLQNRNLTEIDSTVLNLEFLLHLRLDSNSISTIPPEIGLHTGLLSLSLSSNQIETLPQELQKCTALTNLDLSANKLQSTDNRLIQMSKMKTLFLNNNQFTEFPVEILNMKFLSLLEINNNEISSIPEELVENFVQLLIVDFSNNRIDTSLVSPELIQWVSDRNGGDMWIGTQQRF